MKTKSILTYSAATSLIAFLISLGVTQDAAISCAVLAATMATLITLHDYSPRTYFAISSKNLSATRAEKPARAFSTFPGATRRNSGKRALRAV